MAISVSKCQSMLVSPSARKLPATDSSITKLFLLGTDLAAVSTIRILGVEFSNDLSWVPHANKVRLKISRMTSVLHRCSRTTNFDVRRRVFNAFIKPHIFYCLPVWGNLPKTHADLMDLCMRRGLRTVLQDPKAELNTANYHATGIRGFRDTVDYVCCLRVFDAACSSSLNDLFNIDGQAKSTSQMSTRSTDARKLVIRMPKRKCDVNCFCVAGAYTWNSLPNDLTKICIKRNFIVGLERFLNSRIL